MLAHELGHITAGHAVRFDERTKTANGISILSLLLGVGAALAGAGDAAMGIIAAGQQAAQGSFLSFNRDQEAATDLAGVRYLSGAGITGKGMVTFFEKLRGNEIRSGYSQADEAAYSRTHPLTGDRIQVLRGLLGTVDHVFQAIDSVEYGLTDMTHYYGHSGAMQVAASRARGSGVDLTYAESAGGEARLNGASDLLRIEARAKLLNPKWYESMLAHGHSGAD